MSTLTSSVRLLELFLYQSPHWQHRLREAKYLTPNEIACSVEMWAEIFEFRFGYYPHKCDLAWETLLQSERMMAALRVIERRLKKP